MIVRINFGGVNQKLVCERRRTVNLVYADPVGSKKLNLSPKALLVEAFLVSEEEISIGFRMISYLSHHKSGNSSLG